MPTLGGQTALNCTLGLEKAGILSKFNVELIGASVEAINFAEDRGSFHELIKKIGLNIPNIIKINNLSEINNVLDKLNFPVIIRLSYALGGNGTGIAKNAKEFIKICTNAFIRFDAHEVIVDEVLVGWKEFELEVVRDKNDNCIVVCGIENFDPLGIHTGDSITVSPIQTLTDKEYQSMRQAAFAVLRAVGVETGGSNVQFAVHQKTGEMVVIEMNPRVSRSSALASKATGFPIAKIAAKLAVGYTLDELKNDITGNQLPACFEPSLDYIVVKMPRFDFDKFPGTIHLRGPQLQSTGEVMAIGRTFPEALQKAMRSLEIGKNGFGYECASSLLKANEMQLWEIGEAFRRNKSISEIHQITHIDPWFLEQISFIIGEEKKISGKSFEELNPELLKNYKRLGFSDSRLATLLSVSREKIFAYRQQWNIKPVYKRVDSCAGEFFTPTAYLYSSYEKTCEAMPSNKKKMIIIGSGPNRIAQGIEFDYCCVQAAKALRKFGYETIMLNCNPETVSTDYDVVDKLYCTPLFLEDILEIIFLENPEGVFIQYGGQTPLKLAEELHKAGIKLIGLDIASIEITEDREKFRHLLHTLELSQPENYCVSNIEDGDFFATKIGFPIIVRPSFVLGGASMSVIFTNEKLRVCLKNIFDLEIKGPVLLEKFLDNAIEIDVDVISDGKEIFIPAFLEHIEPAGVHSGDSACITPTINLSDEIKLEITRQIKKITDNLMLRGFLNIQFAIKNNDIFILDLNVRASRTIPFLCKVTQLPLVEIAVFCTLGKSLKEQAISLINKLPYYFVKESIFPFMKFHNTSASLGPEMKSTGEVMGIGKTPAEAYGKAQIAAGNMLPKAGNAWVIGADFTNVLTELGFLVSADISPPQNCILVIAVDDRSNSSYFMEKVIRYAIDNDICYATTLNAARFLIDSLSYHLNYPYEEIKLGGFVPNVIQIS